MDGIVLKATPYEEDGKILKLFTKESGIISVIVKKLGRKGASWQTLTSPLARAEFHLTRRQSDLYSLNDASLIDAHFEIRNNLNKLDAACTILRAILTSQYPEKSSPELYELTTLYLKKIKSFPKPATLATSFLMKLLNFEGLFPENSTDASIPLSPEEWLTLQCLCHGRTFALLESLDIDAPLEDKALTLFKERITDFS